MRSLIFVLILSPFMSQAQVLTPEKLWELDRVGEFQVSPNGKTVLYTVRDYDITANKGNTDIYAVDLADGYTRKLTFTTASEFNPRWRPDGRRIGFLSAKDGGVQLWEMNPDGTDMQRLTTIEGGIANFDYAPDGQHISFTRSIKMDPAVQDIYPDLPHAEARIIDDLMYRHWDQWDDYAYSHVFYMRYRDGRVEGDPIDIMHGERYDSPMNPFGGASEIAWSADGKKIAYTCKKKSGKDYTLSTNSEIFLFDLEMKTTKNVSEGLMGYDRDPVFSPNGRWLMWSSMEREGFESDRQRIMVMDLRNGEIEEVTVGLDRNANHPIWAYDSRKIYFVSGEKATAQVFELTLSTKRVKQLTSGRHNYGSVATAGSAWLVGNRMSMDHPSELFKINKYTGEATPLTKVNTAALAELKMGKVEERWITTTDNKQMLTWVIYPPDFDSTKTYPALLYCQGGPQAAVSQFFSFRWNFQLMAAKGYIVVAPNRRGLPSFGQEWNDQISGDWGGQNMKDYLSAIDDVRAEPFVDKNRVGAVGASYGGYSVYWLAGNHENRFNALISHCGLFNLESWYGTTEEMFFANWDQGGPYWKPELKEKYAKFSPHKYVQNWTAPILVIHGARDYRVPLAEGLQAFQAAQLRDVPSRLLYFPDEGHWVLKPQNGLLWHRVFFEWLDEHLGE